MTTGKNILVLGGTRYFGKRLVDLLIRQGHAVTVATRGRTSDPFGSQVERRAVDRCNRAEMATLASERSWDVVVDQICYSPDEAAFSCEVFNGRVGRYIHTSTGSVYMNHGMLRESDFDPYSYPIRLGGRADFDYGEAKRLAEAILFQKARFPVAAMRIPIVLGPDDYTGRLDFHIDRVRTGKPIVIPNLDAETTFIHAAEAARFLFWLVEGDFTGPINASANGTIMIREIMETIESKVGKKANIVSEGEPEDCTSFVDENSMCMDNSKARNLGFEFTDLRSWFPGLVQELNQRLAEGR